MTVFRWDRAKVLAAIDAGIPEVLRMFDRYYAAAWTHGVGLVIAQGQPLPVFHPRMAYDAAFDQTIATLNALESLVAVADHARPTEAEATFLRALFSTKAKAAA